MKKVYTTILLTFLAFNLMAQEVTISGTIKDSEDGEPLIGANVIEKGTTNGTITDFDGNYKLTVSSKDVTLIFSYVGYKRKEIDVNNQTTIDVDLTLDMSELDEVVVVGYGSVRKSDLTGSVASIKSEDLVKVPNANPVQALQGKVSGLQVLNTSGDPGSTPVVRLRGITTLNNNNPIFVVDGVIIEEGNSLDFLNANDIESVEVLKDASATAIFGSRGSNGVIIVTTKRGKKGDVRVNVSMDHSWESVSKRIEMMNGREFAQYVNDIEPGTYNNLDVLDDTDWQDLIYEDMRPIRNVSASISSATDKIDYYFGLGYFYQEGLLGVGEGSNFDPQSEFERVTAKINTTYKVTEAFDIGLNLSLALRDKQNAPGVINTALRAWPISVPFNDDGTFAEVRGSANALAAMEYSNSYRKSFESVGNFYLEYDFLDGFTAKSSFQFTAGAGRSKSFTPAFYVAPLQQNETSDISVNYSDNSFVLWENTISYQKEFGIHRVNSVAGYTIQRESSEFLSGSGQNLLRENENYWYINASDGDPLLQNVSNNGGYGSMVSFLFRANYTLLDRYLFTATFRRDGSSNFGSRNRYGNFPSFALGWNVSEESFFPTTRFIDNLKVRASWGIVGNEKIGGGAQFSTIGTGFGAVFGVNETLNSGATLASAGNPDLRWEETEQFDVGINMDLLQGRLIAEFDYYVKTTNDILVRLEPAGYLGVGAFQSITYNVANVQNKGFEFNLTWRDKIGDFNYQVGGLGSFVENEVLNLGANIGADSVITGGDLGNGQRVAQTVVGYPIGFFYGYKVAGVFQNEAQLEEFPSLSAQRAGDFIYEDTNEDGILNAEDRTVIGNSIPDFIYGFNASVGYKNINLSCDFQGQTGVDIYNGKQAITSSLYNREAKFNNRWTGEGSTNEHPRATQGGVNYSPSDYFVEDGSFLRLRTLTLSYDIPSGLLESVKAQSLRFYVRGTNLVTFTKYSGYSPDLGAGSPLDGVIDRGVYPISKVYSAGLNLTF